jgi:hypothetical protein
MKYQKGSIVYHTKDLRRLAKQLEIPAKQLKIAVGVIVDDELEKVKKRLIAYASGGKVDKFHGNLARAAVSRVVKETPYTIRAMFGYESGDRDIQSQANTLTGNARMPIKPIDARMLAFPAKSASPSWILNRSGTKCKTVAEAKKRYALVFKDNAILGRLRHSKLRRLFFLYVRRDKVTVPQYIDLDSELEVVSSNIQRRVAEEF